MVSLIKKFGINTVEATRCINTINKSCSMMASESRLVAVTQMTSTADKDNNIATCKSLIEIAASRGAQMVFLPEAFDYIGEKREQSVGWAQPLDGPLLSTFKDFARQYNVWLSLGGMHQRGTPEKVLNTHIILNNEGEMVSTYSKTHLYDVDLPEKGIRLVESDYAIPGKEIVPPVETPVGKVGLSICYDLRFAELSLCQRRWGADILTFPSAFTLHTGLAHWEPLLRARAIEAQCYVIAAAQTGKHNAKRSSFGHAMIVDPWGSVVAQCREGTDVALAHIDLPYLKKIREEMPVMKHRRTDLYPIISPPTSDSCGDSFPKDEEVIPFGSVSIKGKMVFACSQQSIASVNKKCVVPGHVLVLPRRPAKRMSDLHPSEVSDLFLLVQKVQVAIEKHYNTTSSTVAVQDGVDAGQSIQHVHVHVLPRKPNDFKKNDEIYEQLEKHDKGDVRWREEEEMEKESRELRKMFC